MTIEKANGTVVAGNEVCKQITGAPEVSADTSTVATAAGTTIWRCIVMWSVVPIFLSDPPAVDSVVAPMVASSPVSFIASLLD